MANDILIIHPPEKDSITVNITRPQDVVQYTIIHPGPRGAVGATGATGPTGSTGATGAVGTGKSPFFVINTIDYATTSSLSLNSFVSSSLTPHTASGALFHSLGSQEFAWKTLYVGTGSINFIEGGAILSTLSAGSNFINIGSSYIYTGSFGFTDNPIIINNTSDVTIRATGSLELEITDRSGLVVRSGSLEVVKTDSSGRFVLWNFTSDPGAVTGGLFFSGSNFYIGL